TLVSCRGRPSAHRRSGRGRGRHSRARLDPGELWLQVALVKQREPEDGGVGAVFGSVSAVKRDLHLGPRVVQEQSRLDPAESGHADIEQRDTWILPKAELDRVNAIGCLKDLNPGDRVAELKGE